MNADPSDSYNEVEMDHMDYQPWSNELPSESALLQNPNGLTDLPQETSDFQFQGCEGSSSQEPLWDPLSLPQDPGTPPQFDQPSSEQTQVTHFESSSPQSLDCSMGSKMYIKRAWHRSDGDTVVSRDTSQEMDDCPPFVPHPMFLRSPHQENASQGVSG
ncbi:MAG TPA: hypothetical protein VGO47_06000 [Chlamydiales bacterium]|nr:hypothetical protein [Chlamydiales bacterium]